MYQSTLISKFVNCMMYGGKKSTAQRILYNAMNIIQKKTQRRSAEALQEGRRERQAGAGSEVPPRGRFDLPGAGRSQSGAANIAGIRWILTYSRARGEKSMEEKLAGELIDAANNRGNSIKKKEDTHRMAEANKAFAIIGGEEVREVYASYALHSKKHEISASWRTSMPAKPRRRSDPLLHRHQLQDRRSA